MRFDTKHDVVTIFLSGHIDSTNAGRVEDEVSTILSSHPHDKLILDLDELEYISSAGLRIILKLRKQYADLRLINASTEVYEIFDMTGFTEMINIEKAYRKFSIDNCEVVGEGANGKVYRIDHDTIVKVYKDTESFDDIKRERELARTAFILGVPTAIPYDVVRVGDRYGSVFELLNAKSFAELMREDSANLEYVAQHSMELAKILHSTKAPSNLPHQTAITLGWLNDIQTYFTPGQFQKFKDMVESLPDNGNMLHGDFHIKNIMQQNGETLLIDMDTLCIGHPIYEFAFMFNAYKGFNIADPMAIQNFLRIPADTAYALWRRSIELYFDTTDNAFLDDVEKKASLIGYMRILRRLIRRCLHVTENGEQQVAACKEKVIELLSDIDTLEY